MHNHSIYYERVSRSVEFLKNWDSKEEVPEIAVVLGSGLANVVPNYSNMKCISYSEIPGFKATHVPGHPGELRIGEVSSSSTATKRNKRRIAFLHGRNHAYEGNDPGEVVHNIRALIKWGVKGIILTNAAGCLNNSWELGKIMFISDHINATGLSPIVGEYGKDFGPRFVDMTNSYSHSWQIQFKATATDLNEEFYSGVYYGVLGPQYETPAEIKMMQAVGAQAVGMSTVLETIAAKQMKAKIAGISCLTNYAAGLNNSPLTHDEVMAMGKKFARSIGEVVLNTIVHLEV